MNLRFQFLLVVVLGISSRILAQDPNGSYLPDFGSLSPNAAGLGKFGDVPIGYYTGTPQIEIPIYSVSEGKLKMDIKLRYHASGIQVDQRSTSVGLGWVLDAGGVITRKIRGLYDERKSFGFLNVKNWANGNDINDAVWQDLTTTFSYPTAVVTEHLKYNYEDPAPDEFTYNFCGRIGKFYFTKEGIPYATDKIKIEVFQRPRPTATAINEIYKWKVTTEDGTQFFFEEIENARTNGVLDINMAWYLTRIVSPTTSTINLTYNRFDHILRDYLPGEYMFEDNSKCSGNNGDIYYSPDGQQVVSDGVFLSSISTSNLTVAFDIVDNAQFINKTVSAIRIIRKNLQEVKRYTFNYKDFGTKRFLLDQIQESSGGTQIPPYKFTYDETPIPIISSVVGGSERSYGGLDYWGYYNGPTTVYDSRIQKAIVIPQYTGMPNRDPSLEFARAGTLTKITYPTGGYTQFDYELNDYSYISNKVVKQNIVKGGGLRITTLTEYDGLDHSNDIVKSYSYKSQDTQVNSSGVIANDPQTIFNYSSPQTSHHKPFNATISLPSSILPIDIGYSQVVETLSDGSFTVYRYSTERDYPNTPYNDDVSIIMYDGLPNYDSDFARRSHPFTPSLGKYYYMKGLLQQTFVYDAQGLLEEKRIYTYEPRETGAIKIFSISQGYGPELVCQDVPIVMYFEQSYTQAIGHPVLTEEQHIQYQNDYPTLVEDKKYEYDANHWQLSKIRTAQSDGTEHVNIFRYPPDFGTISTSANSQALAIKNLQDNNIINPVIEEYSYTQNADQTNQKIIDGNLKIYRSNQPYISELFKLDLSSSISLSSFSSSSIQSGLTFIKDANYKSKSSFDQYDEVGNLRQFSKTNDIKTSYVWGYNRAFPIAKVENSTSDNVRITSFEEPFLSPAELSSTGILSTSTSKRGSQSLYLNNQYTGLILSGLTPSTTLYKLSFWIYGAAQNFTITNGSTTTSYTSPFSAGWNYFETTLAPASTISIKSLSTPANSIYLDELRFAPQNSVITTFLYDPIFGMTSETDHFERSNYYEYDILGRLKLKRNNDGNIVSTYGYNYKN